MPGAPGSEWQSSIAADENEGRLQAEDPLVDPAPSSLFEELQRRRVFRALVAYGVVAFTLLQIAEPIMHGLH